jgi:hypothetical protein
MIGRHLTAILPAQEMTSPLMTERPDDPAWLLFPCREPVDETWHLACVPIDEVRVRLCLDMTEEAGELSERHERNCAIRFDEAEWVRVFDFHDPPDQLAWLFSEGGMGDYADRPRIVVAAEPSDGSPWLRTAHVGVDAGRDHLAWEIWLKGAPAPLEVPAIPTSTFLRYLMRVAPDDEVPSVFTDLARADSRQALELLEAGVTLSGEVTESPREILPLLDPGAWTILLDDGDREVRLRALALFGRLRQG